MPSPEEHFATARNYAADHLKTMKDRTEATIQKVAQIAAETQIRTAGMFGETITIDIARLEAELRHLFSVLVDRATVLEDPSQHVPWLPARRSEITWSFWNRYRTYLERDFGMAPIVVENLHELTNMALERLEDPRREAPWDRRGMTVGSVQSGKTANYIGLICKAMDAGYKLVIVLAGIHSNLRAQTQVRIDEGVLGFDTQKSRRLNSDSHLIGVGKLPGPRLLVHSLTNSADNGDFNKTVAENIGVMLGGDPVVLVVKKNSKLLGNLLKWVLHVAGVEDPQTHKKIVRNIPLLLVDDEADNASINTKARPGVSDPETVTAINGKIRKLLDSFDKSAYVGYTATPFANIFINPGAETPEHGEDLFPRSFIINVSPPTNYVGPAKVFGLDGDPDAGIASNEALPIVRVIDDYAEAFPPRHTTELVPEVLPESLTRAIRCFILVCAARKARGQGARHNSMLVHVTRFINVQGHVVSLIRNELSSLQRRIEFGDGARRPALLDELEAVWGAEFAPVSKVMGSVAGPAVTWLQVRAALHAAASKIAVMPINGYAKEALDYKEHEADGCSVIAVGGDKLSRGLTLEGLSVSYFLRTSRMYDTLMQMGRWFGYRPGYLDLCRLFTTQTLVDWYRHIALAEAELRREFEYMVAAGLTPEKYGLRVRTHPDGMIVTALNKMSHGRTLELSWAGVLAQTTQLPKDTASVSANEKATIALLSQLPPATPSSIPRSTRVWNGIPSRHIADFIETLRFPPKSARASGAQLASFIRKQASKVPAELAEWTVALISNSQASADFRRAMGAFDVGLIERTPESQSPGAVALKKANILNPEDESCDLNGAIFDKTWLEAILGKRELQHDVSWLSEQLGRLAVDVALALTIRWQQTDPPRVRKPKIGRTTRPNGRAIRALRRPTHGLLLIYPVRQPKEVPACDGHEAEQTGMDPNGTPLIGVALSFPTSETTLGVEYRVNTVWGSEIAEDEAYED